MIPMTCRKIFFLLLESFFTTWALMYAPWNAMVSDNLLGGILFLLCFLFFRHSTQCQAKIPGQTPENIPAPKPLRKKFTRGNTGVSVLLAVLFTPLYMWFDSPFYTYMFENPTFRLVFIGIRAVGFFFLFFHFLRFLFAIMADKKRCLTLLTGNSTADSFPSARPFSRFRWLSRLPGFYDRHLGIITFLCCMLGFLPYFLYLYPGVLTPDGLNQLRQVLDVVPYSNHHPVVHTLLIGLCYRFAQLFTSDLTTAVAFYTFFQMSVMALTTAFLVKTVRKLKVRRLICVLLTGIYALVPYHGIYAVTIWKDVLFSAGVLLFTVALFRLYREIRGGQTSVQKVCCGSDANAYGQEVNNDSDSAPSEREVNNDSGTAVSGRKSRLGKITPASLALYIFSGLILCLFRSNGWYAYLLSLPFLIYFFRSVLKIMLPVHLGLLLTVLLIRGPIMTAFHVAQPDLVENLSIPLQQVAYVIYNERELSLAQQNLIDAVIDADHVKELYTSYLADNIKELVRAGHPEYLEAHRWEYLKLWISLGLAYPQDYLTAYVNQTRGYWSPRIIYPVAENEGISPTSLPIFHTPLIRGPVIVKLKEIALKLHRIIPLYGLIWNIGTLFWTLLFFVGCAVLRRERWKVALYLPGLAVMATVLIATPVADDFRYAYPLVYAIPFYAIIAFWHPEEDSPTNNT